MATNWPSAMGSPRISVSRVAVRAKWRTGATQRSISSTARSTRGRDGSALVYEFRAAPPFQSTPVSSERSRQIVAATFLSDQDLAGTREVRVLGARSSRSARR